MLMKNFLLDYIQSSVQFAKLIVSNDFFLFFFHSSKKNKKKNFFMLLIFYLTKKLFPCQNIIQINSINFQIFNYYFYISFFLRFHCFAFFNFTSSLKDNKNIFNSNKQKLHTRKKGKKLKLNK